MSNPILEYYQQLRNDISARVNLVMSQQKMSAADLAVKVEKKTNMKYSIALENITNVRARQVPGNLPYWYGEEHIGDLEGLANILFTCELRQDDPLIEKIGEDYKVFVYPPLGVSAEKDL